MLMFVKIKSREMLVYAQVNRNNNHVKCHNVSQ